MHEKCQSKLTETDRHWADFFKYNKRNIKKKNSRSTSMFEITDNPYADENCYCCNDENNNSSDIDSAATVRRSSINPSLIYSLLTTSTLNQNQHDSAPALFILRFSHLLISCGAPSHRLDNCLQLLIQKFSMRAQFGYFPGFLVVSFGDMGN